MVQIIISWRKKATNYFNFLNSEHLFQPNVTDYIYRKIYK
uniref:Uncharacterized protein n=1 Tax=Anguilla anguilla TaxID=7936 RepID=A0A0E9UVN7_ANGAN